MHLEFWYFKEEEWRSIQGTYVNSRNLEYKNINTFDRYRIQIWYYTVHVFFDMCHSSLH